jgi:hypothetical protein
MAASNLATAKTALCSVHALPNEFLVGFGCLVVVGCLGVVHAWRVARPGRLGLEAIDTAKRYAESGQLAVATKLLATQARSSKEMSIYAQAALGNLHLRRGHLGHALGMFSCLMRTTPRARKDIRRSLEDSLGYVLAAAGDLEFAEHFRSATNRHSDPRSPLGCLLLCRRGQFEEVVDASRSLGSFAVATVDAGFDWHAQRVVALLCAFAHAHAPNHSATCPGKLEEFLECARPTYPGEYDYLQRSWPELRSFVERHGARLQTKWSQHIRADIPQALGSFTPRARKTLATETATKRASQAG